MKRRDFLYKSLITGVGLAYSGNFLQASPLPSEKRITILHTNDMHSRIDPFPNDGGRNANQGGMTKLASVITNIRKEEEHLLLLDAGDVFQGTPYFNFYGGELEFKLMSQMGFDASTIGNHEFDNGLEGILEQLPNASFPHIISNYDFSDTILRNKTLPYKIFKKDGVKIGVFGLGIALEGLVAKKNYGNTVYLDPVAIANEMVSELRSKKCELIICLSHLGYSYKGEQIDDLKLASAVSGIDLIIGGHTHTFLDEPALVSNPQGHKTLVHQVGTGALRLGKVDFVFSQDNRMKLASSNSLPIS
ncbi:bifunctional metallophosphatase/5'-nucleotidase [Arthrospiribacter ruber]|uniref:Bifunctional metallophosphatase/5'-nucleotidase n=1 Tax=Arthrospiribacter ruber TaxID=2487934 RepID=A0A951J2B2_9BACT|nr:metallophosphatase [Arthrospiribacter ruber]MBW3469996.1 bifunctional metallophosphatase/5'-nucleotidase [Arthrospiribacter ruber]